MSIYVAGVDERPSSVMETEMSVGKWSTNTVLRDLGTPAEAPMPRKALGSTCSARGGHVIQLAAH